LYKCRKSTIEVGIPFFSGLAIEILNTDLRGLVQLLVNQPEVLFHARELFKDMVIQVAFDNDDFRFFCGLNVEIRLALEQKTG